VVPSNGVEAPELIFGFVNDPSLVRVLDEYYRQTQKAAEAESSLGVVVGCGSVVEGMLTWALLQKQDEAVNSGKAPRKQGKVPPIEQWGLAHLIDVGVDLNIIGKTAKQASWALKDFRNFIHPYNALQQSARPDPALAMSALAALAEITRSLEGRVTR
jgi:hypothetical protein